MKPRILVADDSMAVRSYYVSILQGAGFEIEEAANGLEALEKFCSNRFDLLIADINMPKMHGYELIRKIRKQEEYCFLPVVVISSEAGEQDVVEAFRAGANFYLVKPVEPFLLQIIAKMFTGMR